MLTVVLLIVLLAVAGCTSSASQPAPTAVPTPEIAEVPTEVPAAVPEPTIDPAVAIVLAMTEHVNAEDYAGAADYFADDALIYLVGMPPTGMEIYRGKEQYRTFLEECCTGANFVYEVIPERVEGDVVFASGKTWMDFTRDLGVAPNSWHEIFVVEDGKITLYDSTITEEAWANFKPALREAIPELFEAALPPGETPVDEITIAIADGTCAYDGPMTLQAGELTVNVDVQDQNWDKYAMSFFTLDEGKDMFDLMASTPNPGPPSWSDMVFLKELTPNQSQTYKSFYVKEGLLYMVCWGGSPDIAIGNAGPFVVVE
jgi:ketosteroid isomerase-like protein